MPSNPAEAQSEKDKEFRFLQEDQKIGYILDMLKNIRFGQLTIQKYNNKIVSYNFNGEIKWKIPESEKKKSQGSDGTPT